MFSMQLALLQNNGMNHVLLMAFSFFPPNMYIEYSYEQIVNAANFVCILGHNVYRYEYFQDIPITLIHQIYV